ncbi:MAG: hypothetical protein WD733_06245 [Bryobacterales bacterium]
MSKYFAVIMPAVLGGVLYYAYSTPGYVGSLVRALIDPVLLPVMGLARHMFGGLLG